MKPEGALDFPGAARCAVLPRLAVLEGGFGGDTPEAGPPIHFRTDADPHGARGDRLLEAAALHPHLCAAQVHGVGARIRSAGADLGLRNLLPQPALQLLAHLLGLRFDLLPRLRGESR